MAFPEHFDTATADVGVNEDRSTEELDALADAGEKASNTERPMKAEREAPQSREKTQAEEAWEFEHGGKKVKGNREQIIKWAQMGYDRPQIMQKFNQERSQWETQKQQWENQWGVYKQIDDYAKGNADWWKFIQDQWATRGMHQPGMASGGQSVPPGTGQAGGAPGDPSIAAFNPKISQLEQQLAQVSQVAQMWQQEKIQQKQEAEDKKLDGEVQSIQQQYKDLDWNSPDMNGKTLEVRVLEHAQANGISTFKAAFRDLLYDDLVTRAESQAKINVAKGIQNKSKLGVISESSTSAKGWRPASNKAIRQTSYEELEGDIREELRQGKFK